MTAYTANIILWQTLAIFLIIGASIGIAVSLLLILRPHLMMRIDRIASNWVSTRHLSRLMDRNINFEQWLYQRHRPLGILIVLGSCYMLVYFGMLFDKAAAMKRLTAYAPRWLLDISLDALALASLIGAVVSLFVGLFFWLRPSMLRGVESEANKWLTLRRSTKFLDMPRDDVVRFVANHAQRVGWLLLLGSIYLFFALSRILMS